MRATATGWTTMSISQGLSISALYRPFRIFSIFEAKSNVQYNCIRNVCANPPEEPFEVALWQYVVTTLAVVAGKVSYLFHDDGPRRPVSECWQQ